VVWEGRSREAHVTSAVAQPPEVKAIRADAANIYQSDAQGNQTFPDTDRYFDGQNARRMEAGREASDLGLGCANSTWSFTAQVSWAVGINMLQEAPSPLPATTPKCLSENILIPLDQL
jgi:hypothetical protein